MRRRFYVEGQLLVSNKIIIDQSITNPLQRVSGDINGPIIQWIRENSHRYLCKYSQSAGHMVICQLDCNPTASFTQPIPTTGSFRSMSGSSITTTSGVPFEMSILKIATSGVMYSITVKEKD